MLMSSPRPHCNLRQSVEPRPWPSWPLAPVLLELWPGGKTENLGFALAKANGITWYPAIPQSIWSQSSWSKRIFKQIRAQAILSKYCWTSEACHKRWQSGNFLSSSAPVSLHPQTEPEVCRQSNQSTFVKRAQYMCKEMKSMTYSKPGCVSPVCLYILRYYMCTVCQIWIQKQINHTEPNMWQWWCRSKSVGYRLYIYIYIHVLIIWNVAP